MDGLTPEKAELVRLAVEKAGMTPEEARATVEHPSPVQAEIPGGLQWSPCGCIPFGRGRP